METVTATGASGAKYTYYLAIMSGSWQAKPANYMFARRNPDGSWFVAYIGICEDVSDRMSNHERWAEAVRDYRVTHVLNHINESAAARETEERDLILSLDPPMNTQHRQQRARR
jgi:hypothetical protein